MNLRLRIIIGPEQRIKPEIQEETCEITLSKYKAPGVQILLIPSNNEVDVRRFEMGKGLNDTIWRDDGDILEHAGFEFGFLKDVRMKRFRRVHD